MTKNQQIIESLFFVSTVPLEQKDIIKVFGKSKRMFLAGLMTISAVLSSFLGEHTVIAIMLPIGLSVIKNIDTQQADGKNAVLLTLFSIAYGTIIGSIGTLSLIHI